MTLWPVQKPSNSPVGDEHAGIVRMIICGQARLERTMRKFLPRCGSLRMSTSHEHRFLERSRSCAGVVSFGVLILLPYCRSSKGTE